MSNVFIQVLEVTIAASGTVSGEILIGEGHLVGVRTDSNFTSTNISLQSATKSGGTYLNVVDADGNDPIIVAIADRHYTIAADGIRGLQWCKFVSSATQTNETVIELVIERRK